VILPTISSCYECSLDLVGETVTYPLCTIANTPRIPAHCIEWASVLEWPRLQKGEHPIFWRSITPLMIPDITLDTDSPEHIQWIFEVASKRAREFNISGVTYSLTQGVIKNIIPAIASTNAIIAGIFLLVSMPI
jgi:ubiquitin-activating enzyme E1 C